VNRPELKTLQYRTDGITASKARLVEPTPGTCRGSFSNVLPRVISTLSLVLFVSLSALWITGTVAAVEMGILTQNWFMLFLSAPWVATSLILAWILWIWMEDVMEQGELERWKLSRQQ
jgi:hypothetical protein